MKQGAEVVGFLVEEDGRSVEISGGCFAGNGNGKRKGGFGTWRSFRWLVFWRQ